MAAQTMDLFKITKLFAGPEAVYHIAFFRPSRAGYQDRISRSILDFTEGKNPQCSRWIGLATDMLSKTVKPDLVIRRLEPAETDAASVTPLDMLSESIANACECLYDRTRLHKGELVAQAADSADRGTRQTELQETFAFDAAGLAEDVRVLIVDDIISTGSQLEAITCAIKRELPQAEVYCFALAKTDSGVANTHLDPEYFLNETAPASPFSKTATWTPSRRPQPDDTVRMPVPAPMKRKPVAPLPGGTTLSRVKVAALGLLVIILVVGALVPFRSSKDALASPEAPQVSNVGIVAEPISEYVPPLPAKAAPASPMVEKAAGPLAVVTVPSAGLRANHAMSSKVIPKSSLRNGEKVAVLARHAPGDGPSWVQVRTRNGKVGWMLASLVHVRR